ncbi:MAG: hypothetical protein ACP5NX_04665 [Candidatus Bilamarchaeaceae archaeon]
MCAKKVRGGKTPTVEGRPVAPLPSKDPLVEPKVCQDISGMKECKSQSSFLLRKVISGFTENHAAGAERDHAISMIMRAYFVADGLYNPIGGAPKRRDDGTFAILHPLRVAMGVACRTGDGPGRIISALLHDVLEDFGATKGDPSGVNYHDIESWFGPDVAGRLMVLSKPRYTGLVGQGGRILRRGEWVRADDPRYYQCDAQDIKKNARLAEEREFIYYQSLRYARNVGAFIIKMFDLMDNVGSLAGVDKAKAERKLRQAVMMLPSIDSIQPDLSRFFRDEIRAFCSRFSISRENLLIPGLELPGWHNVFVNLPVCLLDISKMRPIGFQVNVYVLDSFVHSGAIIYDEDVAASERAVRLGDLGSFEIGFPELGLDYCALLRGAARAAGLGQVSFDEPVKGEAVGGGGSLVSPKTNAHENMVRVSGLHEGSWASSFRIHGAVWDVKTNVSTYKQVLYSVEHLGGDGVWTSISKAYESSADLLKIDLSRLDAGARGRIDSARAVYEGVIGLVKRLQDEEMKWRIEAREYFEGRGITSTVEAKRLFSLIRRDFVDGKEVFLMRENENAVWAPLAGLHELKDYAYSSGTLVRKG